MAYALLVYISPSLSYECKVPHSSRPLVPQCQDMRPVSWLKDAETKLDLKTWNAFSISHLLSPYPPREMALLGVGAFSIDDLYCSERHAVRSSSGAIALLGISGSHEKLVQASHRPGKLLDIGDSLRMGSSYM